MEMLAVKYRPKTIHDIVGQEKAKKIIETLAKQGYGGMALWISGPSGTGKTTIARIIAAEVAEPYNVIEHTGDSLTVAIIADIERECSYIPIGNRRGRAIFVNESHGMKKPVVRKLDDTLERIPPSVTWIFTTTTEGMELFEDGIESKPLLDRCISVPLTSQGLCELAAEYVHGIADLEGLNGCGTEEYVKSAKRNRNSIRGMLAEVQRGVFVR